MSRWFRHYAGMMRDDKLVGAAIRSKQPVERVVWVWGAILESAGEVNDGGRYEFDAAEVAYFLRADEADIHSIISALTLAGRVDSGIVVNWGARQFQSDRSAPRQAAYRERKRTNIRHCDDGNSVSDAGVTATSRHSDAPETETETDRKKVSRTPDAPDDGEFLKFLASFPKRKGGNPVKPARIKFNSLVRTGTDPALLISEALKLNREMADAGKIDTPYVPQMLTWLNQDRFADAAAHAAVAMMLESETQERIAKQFYVRTETPQWDAWTKHNGKSSAYDKNGGWYFPSEWPPGFEAAA